MSFSTNITGKSKDEVKTKLSEFLDELVKGQDAHNHDRNAIAICSLQYLDLLNVKEGQTVSLSLSGSLGWNAKIDAKSLEQSEREFNGAGLNISARCYDSP